MNDTTTRKGDTMTKLEEAFEDSFTHAQLDGRGIDYRAGILFAYTHLASASEMLPASVATVPAKAVISDKVAVDRYHKLVRHQTQYVSNVESMARHHKALRTEHETFYASLASRVRDAKGKGVVQDFTRTDDYGTVRTRKDLWASLRGSADLRQRLARLAG